MKHQTIQTSTPQVFLLAMSVFLLSLGSPVPSPDPLIPALSSLMGPLVSVLQTVGTTGGAITAETAGVGGLVTAPVVAGTVATAPAVVPAAMMMSSLLPGIGIGLLTGSFLGIIPAFGWNKKFKQIHFS